MKLSNKWLGVSGLGAGIAIGLIIVGAFRPIYAWRLRQEGFVLTVDRPTVTVRERPNNRGAHEVVFAVRNITDSPVTVLGVRESCECFTTTGLPLVIPEFANKELVFRVTAKVPEGEDVIERNAVLLVDRPSPRLQLTVRVMGDSKSLGSGKL